MPNNCPFCKIANNELPSRIVYEDDEIVAFLDRRPITRGHTMIIPRKHYENLLTIPPELAGKITSTAQHLATDYAAILKADGFNLRLNSGTVAHQEVMHYHLHLVPRYADDQVDMSVRQRQHHEDLDDIWQRLRRDSQL